MAKLYESEFMEMGIVSDGYTFRCRDEYQPYPTPQYRWDNEFRDWVTREVNGQVEAYQVKQRGNVPNGIVITNTTWWERNDAHLQKTTASKIVGNIARAKTESLTQVVTTQSQMHNVCVALSGGAQNGYNLDIDTLVIQDSVGMYIYLPNPAKFIGRRLTIVYSSTADSCALYSSGWLHVYQGTSNTRIITAGCANKVGDNWKNLSTTPVTGYRTFELQSSAGANYLQLAQIECGSYAVYEFFGVVINGVNHWLHTNLSELAGKATSSELDSMHRAGRWVHGVGSEKKSPRLAALIIEGTYTTANNYTIDGQFGYIEWDGSSSRNGIGLASYLPVGFTCEVQNNSTLYNLAISGTVLTNINYVPKRTIVRIRKLQSGLLVTLAASLSATGGKV